MACRFFHCGIHSLACHLYLFLCDQKPIVQFLECVCGVAVVSQIINARNDIFMYLNCVQVFLLRGSVLSHRIGFSGIDAARPARHNKENQHHQQQRHNPSRQQKGIAERRELNDRLMLGGGLVKS